MRTTPLFRLVALWALSVFTLSWGGDALMLHPCPHHSALGVAAAAAPGHAAAHGGHAAQPEHAPDPAAHSGGCTCVVACAGSSVMLPPLAGETPSLAFDVPAPSPPLVPARAPLPARAHFVLPFSTAPPPAVS